MTCCSYLRVVSCPFPSDVFIFLLFRLSASQRGYSLFTKRSIDRPTDQPTNWFIGVIIIIVISEVQLEMYLVNAAGYFECNAVSPPSAYWMCTRITHILVRVNHALVSGCPLLVCAQVHAFIPLAYLFIYSFV